MIKMVVRDEFFLRIPSQKATIDDIQIADDLNDTLKANIKGCVGMAANMIGYSKCIINYVDSSNKIVEMINPEIIEAHNPYETEEGCLSLSGTRKTTRYKKIKVEFYTRQMKKKIVTLSGFQAQIVQHEIDHTKGILI